MKTDSEDARWSRVRAAFGSVPYARLLGLELCKTESGQTAVCLILGTFYAGALSIIGLNFGALIGMLSGLLSFMSAVDWEGTSTVTSCPDIPSTW